VRIKTWWICVLLWAMLVSDAVAIEKLYLNPNPAYSRDLGMGCSTIALTYSLQSQSINPAGFALFEPNTKLRGSLFLNPGALWHLKTYFLDDANVNRSGAEEQISDALRFAVSGVAVQSQVITVAALLSQPVMLHGDTARYRYYVEKSPLTDHQNSVLVALALHPRVSIGGRVDYYFAQGGRGGEDYGGEGYSYGVILRPKNVALGVQYQKFPTSGARLWHPLDRRSTESTSAGLAVTRDDVTFTVQVMNLTQSSQEAFLEPHAGIEWRAVRGLALRAGGMQFTRTAKWAWTTGLSLLDANWLRKRAARLVVPDDVLQMALAVVYERRTPVLGIASLTCSWRF
jgi:hypothetical protein